MRYILALLIFGIISCSPKQKDNSNIANPAETPETTTTDPSSDWENVKVSELKEIGYYPAFLPSGNEIIFSTSNYQGLYLYNLKDQSKTELTTARGAGYNPQIKDESILYEVKSKTTSYESIDLNSKKSNVLADVEGGSLKAYASKASSGPVAVVASDLNSIDLYKNGKVIKSISPAGYKNIVNATVSPNGENILLEVSGKGGFIVDLDGKLTHNLGDLDKPSWINDNEILYAKIKDDGMKTTGGEIFIKNISTQKEYRISSEFKGILENPKSNSEGDQVIANTPDGKIILISKN
ncbi:hypothetical protein [Portibacter lacus]|uniref:Uncharacterized protein n=1 Tax=Portibacter lacus TaxID=1099794 RepID=A0AA37SLU5_9BACT|nr:hypothetical protein [Portibacter lacus]GLR16771.1 hypothetical protein GCM10007940_13860 [Portibacter lacus]